jgi:hypothetical protein
MMSIHPLHLTTAAGSVFVVQVPSAAAAGELERSGSGDNRMGKTLTDTRHRRRVIRPQVIV